MLAWSRPDPLTRDLIHLINARRHDHGDTDAAIDTLQAFLEQGRESDLLTVLAALDEDMAEWLFDLLAEASCTLALDDSTEEKPSYATMAALELPLQANLTAPLKLKIDPIATADLLHRHLAHPFRKPILDYNREAFAEAMVAWRAWNPNAPLILDAGCGVGWSTLRIAERYPDLKLILDHCGLNRHGQDAEAFIHLDEMLALAKLQRKLRLLESPYRTPQTLVGGPRADAGLMAISGRTSP